MRIQAISVTNLFGIFNHFVKFHVEEHITIIHGPNGYGKTVLLKMIDAIFNGHYAVLRSLPFSDFRINFDNGSELWITRNVDPHQLELDLSQHRETLPRQLSVALLQGGSEVESFVYGRVDPQLERHFALDALESFIPGLDRIGPMTWIYRVTSETLSYDEVVDRFGDRLPAPLNRAEKEPQWLQSLRLSIPVRFIETQRLLSITPRRARESDRQQSFVPAVEVYSQQLGQLIQTTLAESTAISQSLDRSFPARLVGHHHPAPLTDDELKERLISLEEKRSRLMAAGLLDKDTDVDFQVQQEIEESVKTVLTVYIEDVERKLSVFDALVSKLELLKRVINERFRYKQMTISKERGFVFTTFLGDALPLTGLSSGEQHELVLLYELLFRLTPDSLILIDEPELSLHILWQEQFLKDLLQITQLASFDVLIATHSPQIINDRWDLTVELKGPEE